ncbi:MAG: restriction endonuclease [Prevotellaceae bacterium]|jgi:site-specific DNA-methyltransferase (adenine-specific)|nr:restriction endonuclease [Prevotellaceae bacterium]
MQKNRLYYGDNLEIIPKIPLESVDLCYIDPPFNSNRDYNLIYNNVGKEDKAQVQAFTDTWEWDNAAIDGYNEIISNENNFYTLQTVNLIEALYKILKQGNLLAYIVSMTQRIAHIYRVLKPTGSFYLHCDPTASHYLKLVLDSIFCPKGGDFRNEIAWCYKSRPQSKKYFGKKHDVIFFYTKSNKYTFNWADVARPLSESTKKKYRLIDENGRKYRLQGRGIKGSPVCSAKDVDIKWEQTNPELVVRDYLDEKIGVALEDWWEIDIINQSAKERLGYSTQKPEALLERIIEASSNESDVILDAYCGCGTTVAVAEKLKRRWIGIDITYQSISLILKRLEEKFENGKQLIEDINLAGVPQDLESARALANKKDDRTRKEFEKWAILTFANNRAYINEQKGADKGIDGIAKMAVSAEESKDVLFSVKSGKVDVAQIRDFRGTIEREGAALGFFITLQNPTKPMLQEARDAGQFNNPLIDRKIDKIQIVTIEQILKKERMSLPLMRDILKKAQRQQSDVRNLIEF